MFAFIGAGEDILKVASTISITNTVLWDKTKEGTRIMFSVAGKANERFYDKMAAPRCAEASIEERKKMRRQFAEECYEEPVQ